MVEIVPNECFEIIFNYRGSDGLNVRFTSCWFFMKPTIYDELRIVDYLNFEGIFSPHPEVRRPRGQGSSLCDTMAIFMRTFDILKFTGIGSSRSMVIHFLMVINLATSIFILQSISFY